MTIMQERVRHAISNPHKYSRAKLAAMHKALVSNLRQFEEWIPWPALQQSFADDVRLLKQILDRK